MRCFPSKSGSRGLPVIVLEDAAEPLLAAEPVWLDRPGAGGRLSACGHGESQRGVRPLPVVVAIDVLGEQVIEMTRAEDDEVGYMCYAGGRMHEYQNEGIAQPSRREHAQRQEVAGPQGVGMAFEELRPSRLAALRSGGQALLLENVDDRGARDARNPQLSKLAEDADISKPSLPRDPQHDPADVLGRSWPSRPANRRLPFGSLPGLPYPLQEGRRGGIILP
jgi:hypothetical protein